MRFISNIRALLIAVWLGCSVFFIASAAAAFGVLPERELAGAVVNRELAFLNYGGIAVAVILLITSIFSGNANRFWLWIERFLLLVLAAACAIGEFVIAFWMSSLKAQIGMPIDQAAVDDPLRVQFNLLHQWSEWVLLAGMIAALIAFFTMVTRRFNTAVKKDDNAPYDFSKEFKV